MKSSTPQTRPGAHCEVVICARRAPLKSGPGGPGYASATPRAQAVREAALSVIAVCCRSPCGSNTRLASPAFRLPLPGLHEHAFAAAPSAFDGPEGFGSPTKSLARMAPQGGSAKDTW